MPDTDPFETTSSKASTQSNKSKKSGFPDTDPFLDTPSSSSDLKLKGTVATKTINLSDLSTILGDNASSLEKVYSEGKLTPEAFGQTDDLSKKEFAKLTKVLDAERDIAIEYKKLQDQAKPGYKFSSQKEVDDYKANLVVIAGKLVPELDVKGNPKLDKDGTPLMTREGGTLLKARQNASEAWGKVAPSLIHKGSAIKGEYLGINPNNGDIQTGTVFEQKTQAVYQEKSTDMQSSDAYADNQNGKLFLGYTPAFNYIEKTANQIAAAKKAMLVNTDAIAATFTTNSLSNLSSKNVEDQRVAYDWIMGVINYPTSDAINYDWFGDGVAKVQSNLFVRAVRDQVKDLSYEEQLKYLSSPKIKKIISDNWLKQPSSIKQDLLSNAFKNKNAITTNVENFPATADKSSQDFKDDLLISEEINEFAKEWDQDEKKIYENSKQYVSAKTKNKIFSEVRGNNPDTSIYSQLKAPAAAETFAYDSAFTADGDVVPYDQWLKGMVTKKHTRRETLTGTWLGLGKYLGTDKDETVTKSMANWLGWDYDENANLNWMKDGKGGQISDPKAASKFWYANSSILEEDIAKGSDLKKVYNNIVATSKRAYDQVQMDDIYTKNQVMGGLGNNSAFSALTIGLDAQIDPKTNALINTGTNPDLGTPETKYLLSKQHNFGKVFNILSHNNEWVHGASADVAITNTFPHNMSKSDYNESKEGNEENLENFFTSENMGRTQMTFMKYSSLAGHSVYKFTNPESDKDKKSVIYATIPNTKLAEIEEDNYTYSKSNFMQKTFMMDGIKQLENRKGADNKNIFLSTPEAPGPQLTHSNGQYRLAFSYYDSKGNEQSISHPLGYLNSMGVVQAQRKANLILDDLVANEDLNNLNSAQD
jgi:hypothetical protein